MTKKFEISTVFVVAFIVGGLSLSTSCPTAAQAIRSMMKYYSGNCTGQDINSNNFVTAFTGSDPVANFITPSLGGPFYSKVVGADISIFQFPHGFQYAYVSLPGFPYTILVWTAGPNGSHGKNAFMNGSYVPIDKSSMLYFDLVCDNNGSPWQAYVTIWFLP